MARRPASITQADIARAIRAAKQTGAAEVEVCVKGRLRIVNS
jgi:DNA-binding XRE family transcriptional regulator